MKGESLDTYSALNRKIHYMGFAPESVLKVGLGLAVVTLLTSLFLGYMPWFLGVPLTGIIAGIAANATLKHSRFHLQRIRAGHPSSHSSEKVKDKNSRYIIDRQAFTTL